MIEEQCLDADLKYIYEWIEALNVRQFVGDHGAKLMFREAGERGHGQEYDGAKPSDHGGSLQPLAFAVGDRATQAKLVLQGVADLEDSVAHDD
jgi:hypothetical protein